MTADRSGDVMCIGIAADHGGYPAKEAGVVSIQVKNPDETKRVIEAIVACLDGPHNATRRAEESR